MGSALLSPIFDLIHINKERYFTIVTTLEVFFILVLIIFVTDPFDIPLATVADGEGSSVSFSVFRIHEHTIHPPGFSRDCQILFGVMLAAIFMVASVPVVDEVTQPLAHVVFMLSSFTIALCLVVFAYLSKSPQSHLVTSSCTLTWYIVSGTSVLLSANRLFHFLAVRTFLLAKKTG